MMSDKFTENEINEYIIFIQHEFKDGVPLHPRKKTFERIAPENLKKINDDYLYRKRLFVDYEVERDYKIDIRFFNYNDLKLLTFSTFLYFIEFVDDYTFKCYCSAGKKTHYYLMRLISDAPVKIKFSHEQFSEVTDHTYLIYWELLFDTLKLSTFNITHIEVTYLESHYNEDFGDIERELKRKR